MALGVIEDLSQADFQRCLESREAWDQWRRDAGIPDDAPEADYKMAEKLRTASKDAKLEARREWFIRQALVAMDDVEEALQARNWQTKLASSGSFIASDNPVIVDGLQRGKIGFVNAPIVGYPVNRYLALWSEPLNVGMMRRTTTLSQMATINTFVMLSAGEQLYSHRPDFCWLDENLNYQTDWRLFDKSRFLAKCSSGEEHS